MLKGAMYVPVKFQVDRIWNKRVRIEEARNRKVPRVETRDHSPDPEMNIKTFQSDFRLHS